ncbi:MAG: hypothetical protein LBQ24_01120 [Candidatus Peribacteria bacterium]|nr:hypothetical protein [Candidatus Peribacteria bacterium]
MFIFNKIKSVSAFTEAVLFSLVINAISQKISHSSKFFNSSPSISTLAVPD